MRISISWVDLGCAWSDTAYPPTTRYLTFRALKMDKSSLNSTNILGGFLDSPGCECDLRDGVQTLVRGQGLPFENFRGLHFIQAGVARDRFVHCIVCSTEHGSWQPVRQRACSRDELLRIAAAVE